MEDDDTWKRVGYIPAKFNRLVVYPTWQIHSIVDRTNPNILNAETIRLTINQFVDYPFPRELTSPDAFPSSIYRPVEGTLR